MNKDTIEIMYDKSSCLWSKDVEHNYQYVKSQMSLTGEILRIRGWICLNDIYNALGMPRTKEGQVYGLVYDDKSVENFFELITDFDTDNLIIRVNNVVNLLEVL